jgi:dTDP-3-amino-3,4,6-trideoxy-alpha-D-glucose transaminase
LSEGIKNPRIRVVRESTTCFSVWHLFPIVVHGERESLQTHLKARGVATGVHYPIIIPHQKALEHLPSAQAKFPNAVNMANHELSLPIHPYLTESEVERIISACNSW